MTNTMTAELTLESAISAVPELTLDNADSAQTATEPVQLNENMLTEEERKQVDEFSKKIDVTDSNIVINYGSETQKNVATFSEAALSKVRNKDLGDVGEMLSKLVVEVKGIDEGDKKGLFGFMRKQKNKLMEMKVQYGKTEESVEKIKRQLEEHQKVLLNDISMFDNLYDLNLKYYKELTMYILAGKKRLEDLRNNEMEELRKRAETSGQPEDAQAYNDLVNSCNRFEKKLHDLELTRIVSLQMGPQARLLQNNDVLMLEKIQSSLVNTIPLWKSQMVLALGLEHSRQATAAQNAVTEATNSLLKKNANLLKSGTIAVAKESERGIIDIETLHHTNQQLIESLDEILTIQREGQEKRKATEAELGRLEGELKQKLVDLSGR